jgi:hypothetical protein
VPANPASAQPANALNPNAIAVCLRRGNGPNPARMARFVRRAARGCPAWGTGDAVTSRSCPRATQEGIPAETRTASEWSSEAVVK